MTKEQIMQEIIQKQDELIKMISPRGAEFWGDTSDKYLKLIKDIASLKSRLAEAEEEKKEGWTCPRCGKIHSYLSLTCDCPPKTYTANTYEGAEAGEEEEIDIGKLGWPYDGTDDGER